MNDIKLWSNGTIKMPFMNIPVLHIRKCQPEMWTAVACALQIKPCHSKSRGSVICKYVLISPRRPLMYHMALNQSCSDTAIGNSSDTA